ncbi:MAG: GHKL domain-containing protein [Methyloprofundus sp.]|nr:GHKL domain-containing protein [Methyloprofundus sp.]
MILKLVQIPKTLKKYFILSLIAAASFWPAADILALETLAGFEDRYAIHYLDDYSKQELLLKVTQLPKNSAILFISLFRDVNGQSFVPRDVMTEVSQKANAPTFGMVDTYLGYGIVGGDLLSAGYQGRKYAQIGKKVLNGEPLTTLQDMENGNQTIFDWRQLKRWSIDEDSLPAGSIVRYRELSIWEEYQWEIVAISVIIFTQAFALMGLLIQHRCRRRAEKEAQKLRDERAHISRVLAMGEIAASLAHELNQPLSAIRSYAQAGLRFLKNDPAEPDETSKALEGIIAGNRRAEEVIQRIRMTLKKEPVKRSRLDVQDIIDEAIVLVRSIAREQNISLKSGAVADLPPVFGDRVQLQQVLFNLIINAIEAISDENNALGEIIVLALREKPDMLTISVRDNGVGIDEKQGDILFDAFYTSKPEGMGMGLSISRSIIEEHGGQLWTTRNPDKGSTFFFSVPIYKEHNK